VLVPSAEPAATTTASAVTTVTTVTTTWSASHFHADTAAIKIIAIASFDSVFGITTVIEFNKCECRTRGATLDADVTDAPKLVKKIVKLAFTHVRWQIANVDPTSIVALSASVS
jgi:hypothetical protein